MKIWYDTEFLEDGRTIELISIGLVAEDGREYYAVVDAPWVIGRAIRHDWLRENVLPSLPVKVTASPLALEAVTGHAHTWEWDAGHRDYPAIKPRDLIAAEVRDFILEQPGPELWAWYGAYDHVALCQLWGPMISLPAGIPMWTNDLKQECQRLGNPEVPKQDASGEHNALADARHNREIAAFLAAREAS